MSDAALRAAERALAANPHDRAARLAYARAWERAGFPVVDRDPRVDPRPGDVVGPACISYYDEEGRSCAPFRRHPDHRDLSWETQRFVVAISFDLEDRSKVTHVGWLPKLHEWPPAPERIGVDRGGWPQTVMVKRRTGTKPKGVTWCSIETWRRSHTRHSFPGDVPLWIEPDVWLPAVGVVRVPSCSNCQEPLTDGGVKEPDGAHLCLPCGGAA